jgi:hypothetical protein
MPAWSGRVFVTRTVDGTCRIGNSIPAGVPLNYATVQVVDVTGPVELIDGPGMVTPPNPEQWFDQYRSARFTFEPQPPQDQPPYNDLTKDDHPRAGLHRRTDRRPLREDEAAGRAVVGEHGAAQGAATSLAVADGARATASQQRVRSAGVPDSLRGPSRIS